MQQPEISIHPLIGRLPFEPYFWAQFFHKSFDTITFFNSPYHTTISPEYFQKFYIQKRQGIEI